MQKELTKEQAEQLLLEGIEYLVESNEEKKEVAKTLLSVFKKGIFINLVRLYKEKAIYLSYYILYYLKTLGETIYYEDIFNDAFESIDFEKKIFMMLQKELKVIKKEQNYEKLFPFYEVIQELLILDKNRENKLVQELNEFRLMLEGKSYAIEYPTLPTNQEMKKQVLEKVKVLTAGRP